MSDVNGLKASRGGLTNAFLRRAKQLQAQIKLARSLKTDQAMVEMREHMKKVAESFDKLEDNTITRFTVYSSQAKQAPEISMRNIQPLYFQPGNFKPNEILANAFS